MNRTNPIIATRAFAACLCLAFASVAAPGRGVEATDPDLLERFLAIDASILHLDIGEKARDRAAEHVTRLKMCTTESEPLRRETCVVQGLVGPGGIDGVTMSSAPPQSSVAHALVVNEGSCAALVATVLALSERFDVRFNVVVLRDHVILSSGSAPGTYFEVLDGGRRIDRTALRNDRRASAIEDISPRGFEPFYLDNLAARLAESGDTSAAERAFRRALDVDDGIARIRYNYGTFLLQQSRYDEAEAMLSRAIALGWKDATAFVNRGAARWQLGRMKAARRDFEKALKLDPTNREARANLERLARK